MPAKRISRWRVIPTMDLRIMIALAPSWIWRDAHYLTTPRFTCSQLSFTGGKAGGMTHYATGWSVLGLIDANLGRKDGAMREGRHACDLLPLSMDAWRGPTLIQNLAVIYAKIGDNDRAIERLRTAAQVQNGVHYGELKLNPQWDALRSDARFQEIVGSLA